MLFWPSGNICFRVIKDFIIQTTELFADRAASRAERSFTTPEDIEIIPEDEIDVLNPEDIEAEYGEESPFSKSGCFLNMGLQALDLFKSWKNGELSASEFASSILNTVGRGDIAEAVGGILMPVKKVISVMGAASSIVIPIAVTVGPALIEAVKRCFDDLITQDLHRAQFYQSSEQLYRDYQRKAIEANNEYKRFVQEIKSQNREYEEIKKRDKEVNQSLKNLYDSI